MVGERRTALGGGVSFFFSLPNDFLFLSARDTMNTKKGGGNYDFSIASI